MTNNQTNNKESQEFLDIFFKEHESIIKLRDEINKDYMSIRISNINQKRGLFQQITILSGAILGLISIIDKPIIKEYFLIGIFLNLFLIIFILLYTRETLDRDSIGLKFQQDKYNKIIKEKIKLIYKYLNAGLFTKEIVKKYLKELQSLKSIKLLQEEIDKSSEQKEKRLPEPLNFSGEFIVFLFVLASFFIAISFLLQYRLSLISLFLLILLIFCLTFMDSSTLVVKYVSKFASFLTKKIGDSSTN